jgi:PAS domain S-box-containing protein
MQAANQERVLVLAAPAVDAAANQSVLQAAGVACQACGSLCDLIRELESGAGAILLPEEALAAGETPCLVEALRSQPVWSDLPVLLLCDSGARSQAAIWGAEALGNVTVLERPVRTSTLVSAARAALRARRRQYELRSQLAELRQAEEALRESEGRFSRFMEHLPGLAWIKDLQGRYVYANEAAARVFGTSQADLMGKTDEEVFPAQTAAQFRANDRRALESESGAVQAIEELEHADGVHLSIVSKFRVPAANEQDVLVAGVAFDITEQKRAEAALRRSEQQLRLVIDSLPAVVTYVDRDARYRFCNRTLGTWFGLDPEQVRGRKVVEIMGQAAYDIVRPKMEQAFAGETVSFEAELPYQHGGTRTVEVRYVPDVHPNGTVEGYVALINDVSQRKQAEAALHESQERFRALATNAPAAIFVKDLDGRYTLANPLACEALGRPEGAVGCTDHELLPADVADALRRTDLEVISTGQAVEREEVVRRPGFDRWYLSVKFPLFDAAGRPAGVCGVAIDITDRRRAERAHRESESQLRDADRRKDEFLATLAHELRNPLAPIRNALQIMRLTGHDEAASEQARAMMERQLGQMVRLIDDLLDVSRITRGKLELRKERIDLATVVHSAIDTARPLIDAAGHALLLSLPPEPVYLDADPMRLAQVFSNLLNNAAKYMDRGGRIWLTAGREGGTVIIEVRDAGIGIPPEALSSIFELFTQVDRSLEKSHGGLGIGLTLVKRLVEMHGGSVEAHSEGLGHGARFTARLPVVPLATASAGLSGSERRPAGAVKCRILVADDNRDAAESMGMMLRLMGNEVRTVHDGLRAVEEAAAFRPDVVLLDIGMPGLNGYVAASRIRQQPWGQDMILVAMTGWGQEEDKRRAREAGFSHHLTKPVDIAALAELLPGNRPSSA